MKKMSTNETQPQLFYNIIWNYIYCTAGIIIPTMELVL